jgi:hypothetical protein
MATDPINVAGVRWPNNFQNPTGIIEPASNPAADPINIANDQIPAESARPVYAATKPDTTPSTDATKGRAIDIRV